MGPDVAEIDQRLQVRPVIAVDVEVAGRARRTAQGVQLAMVGAGFAGGVHLQHRRLQAHPAADIGAHRLQRPALEQRGAEGLQHRRLQRAKGRLAITERGGLEAVQPGVDVPRQRQHHLADRLPGLFSQGAQRPSLGLQGGQQLVAVAYAGLEVQRRQP